MDRCFRIGDHKVGPHAPCLIVAEAGVNHSGSLDRAMKLVEAAKTAGADAVKFQLFDVAEQVSRWAETAAYQRERTGSGNMVQMAASYELAWEAHRQIKSRCDELAILYAASCFDRRAVDFLVELGGACIKVASGEITNYPLLADAAKSRLPIVLSTGMSSLEDVAGAVDELRRHGCGSLALLQCTSSYPAEPSTVNLRAMRTMSQAFGVPVGLSDHTEGCAVAAAAVALGARIIEKHFTLDRAVPGPDHAMSLEPLELGDFVRAVRAAEAALGSSVKAIAEGEALTAKVARRSLVALCDIEAGDLLHTGNVTLKRPATGIDPRQWEAVRGRRAAADIPTDVPITWNMLQ